MMFLLATAHAAPAANKPAAVVVHLSGRLDGSFDTVTTSGCVGRGYQYSGTPENKTGAVYKGTLVGVSSYCGKVRMPPVEPNGDVDYHEDHTFIGTVRGCGTGTFKYSLDGVAHPFGSAKGYVPADEYWRIVNGSGTGGLAGIRSGLNHRAAGVNADNTVFAVFDPAKNSLICIPTHRKK